MRRHPLALVAVLVLVPVLGWATPAEATTTTTSSCTDGSGHTWRAKATWGGTYSDHGAKKVSARSVKFTTKTSVSKVDYTVTVTDGTGATVQDLRAAGKKFSFKKGKTYLSRNPKNPPSAPGQTKVALRVGATGDKEAGCTVTFLQPGRAPWTSSASAPAGSWPASPPATICGNAAALAGPATPPAGATVVKAGDNHGIDLTVPGRTYWFAPGVHTLGTHEFSQIEPGDGSTYVGGPGAVLDGQGKNAYAFVGGAKDVTIRYLTIRNFVADRDEGTVNHDSGTGWTVEHSTITHNGGAGVFLGSGNRAAYDCLSENSQYGFQVYSDAGPSGVTLDHNEIVGNDTGDWEAKVDGCGCTGGGKLWDSRHVSLTSNYVHDNRSVGLWADTNNDDVVFEGNWISDNDSAAIIWEISYNAAIRDNVIRHNEAVDGPRRIASGDAFPDAAVYISESGGDARLPYDRVGSPSVDVSGNLVDDNYNGVTLWENADRFCGSPANTSSGDCTLVNPKVTLATCSAALIGLEPYFSDCRWKTQHVHVHDNTFAMDRTHFLGCSPSQCGHNAVLSNYGSYPKWSPYQGDAVERRITFEQDNVFSDNTYVGGWSFVAHDAGTALGASQWQSAPYSQDAGSTFG